MSQARREWFTGLSKLTVTVTSIPTLQRGEPTRLDGQKDMPTVLRVMRHVVDVELVLQSGRIILSTHLDAGVQRDAVNLLPELALVCCAGDDALAVSVSEWLAGQLTVDSLIVPSGGAAR